MQKIRVMITTDHSKKPVWLSIPKKAFHAVSLIIPIGTMLLCYLLYDYAQLAKQKKIFQALTKENAHLKNEAQILLKNVHEVNKKLDQVSDMARQANEFLALKVRGIEKKSGLNHKPEKPAEENKATLQPSAQYVPLGIKLEGLSFGETIKGLHALEQRSQLQTIELRQLLAHLTQHAAFLSSIPTAAPTSG